MKNKQQKIPDLGKKTLEKDQIPRWWVIENIGAVVVDWISSSDNAEKVDFFSSFL